MALAASAAAIPKGVSRTTFFAHFQTCTAAAKHAIDTASDVPIHVAASPEQLTFV
ncbi:MAG: hypothetical protein OXG88_00675 [Gammaproteobacteria bacterium]|nr:hypothetical protein [Gammaproteobacteria bacterium]